MTNEPMQEPGAPAGTDDAGGNPTASELETLRSEVEQLRAEALRERADLENQRKRLARDMESARRFEGW